MMRAVLFYDGKSFAGIAFEGDDAYDRNVARQREFIRPIIIPGDLAPNDVLYALNSGSKRILKTSVNITIGEQSIPHYKLSKR